MGGIEGLRGFVRSLMFGTYEVPGTLAKSATVTPPGGDPIPTAVIWVNQSDAAPPGSGFQREEHRHLVAIRRDHAPAVPRGTLIAGTAPLEGAPTAWVVDSVENIGPDHQIVTVTPAPVDS